MAFVSTTIGIFDSGIGGLAVLSELEWLAPGHPMVYLADQAWMPYGERTLEEVRARSEVMARLLIDRGAGVIVVACNSASAASLHHLRSAFPGVPFVGMEPAVKPAAEQSARGVIGVLATNATFQGELYASVVDRHASGVAIVEQACPKYLPPLIDGGADTVVLGCTHYSFLVSQIEALIGQTAQVIDPAPAVARQALRVLPGPVRSDGHTDYLTTGDAEVFSARIRELRDIAVDPIRVTIPEAASSLSGAVDALRAGLIVGVPTDTVYGIAADPRNPDAIMTLAELKGRAGDRPFPILVASIEQAVALGVFNEPARRLATEYWPGPLTLVVPATGVVPSAGGTIGLRVPDHPVTRALLDAAGPLAVTSANLSGDEEALDDGQARAIFGGKVAVYLEGRSPRGVASTVIDCTAPNPVILRSGPVG